ncbi:MAG: hypothetical protein ACLUD1_12955, partial [Clostridia bacterium]
LLDLALDGLLSKEDLAIKKLFIETQIEQIQAKLKELKSKKTKPEEQKQDRKTLKKYILKELTLNQDNLESYIEGLLDKIIVIEKPSNIKEQIKDKQSISKNNEQNQVELQIMLTGNNLITVDSPTKFR